MASTVKLHGGPCNGLHVPANGFKALQPIRHGREGYRPPAEDDIFAYRDRHGRTRPYPPAKFDMAVYKPDGNGAWQFCGIEEDRGWYDEMAWIHGEGWQSDPKIWAGAGVPMPGKEKP